MSNPNNFSNNPNELEAQGTARDPNWGPPQFVPRHESGTGTGPRSHSYLLRSVRRTTHRTRTDTSTVNRRYKIRLRLNRKVLDLSNESRRSVISAISEALQIGESPTETPNRPEDDRMSYHIELNEPDDDRIDHESARAPTNIFPRRDEGTDNNIDIAVDNFNFDPTLNDEQTDYEEFNNTLDDNIENERPESESYIRNILNRTANGGRHILINLFSRNQPSGGSPHDP